MRTLFAVLIVLTICVVGFGFYRGWFALSSPSPAAGSNNVNVNLSTDTDKIKEDAEAVKDKAADLTGSATERSKEPADPLTDPGQPNQVQVDGGQLQEGESKTLQSNGN